MNAWLFQDHRQRQKLGDKCPWSVGWLDPEGKRRSKRIGSKSRAEKFQRKIEGQLAAGTYEQQNRRSWQDFRKDYESLVMGKMLPGTRADAKYALDHFQRIIEPKKMSRITSKTFDEYVSRRSAEPRQRRKKRNLDGPKVSPATVNKELRTLRAALRKGVKWGYLVRMPEIDFLREPEKLPTYVLPEHFAALYQACTAASLPDGQPFSARDWWQSLLITGYMTGWRIGTILSLRWEDVDLVAATALTRSENSKGKRDYLTPLPTIIVEHLKKLRSFSKLVFPWEKGRRVVFLELHRIQDAAGVKPTSKDYYGFHDLRRAFATMNADTLSADALQHLMQHRDYQTTKRYINIARQLKPAVQRLFVPDLTPAVANGN